MRKVIVFGVDGLSMPLLKRYAAQGCLPNITKMLEQGAATELLPFISAWGDVNWVTFMAGQAPGTAWTGQGMPPDNAQTRNLLGLMSEHRQRAALVHFPESVCADKDHFAFAPYWGRSAAWPQEIFKPMGFTCRLDARLGKKAVKQQTLGWPPNSALVYHDKGAWQALEADDEGYTLKMKGNRGEEVRAKLVLSQGKALLHIAQQEILLLSGAWSRWIDLQQAGIAGSVRFWLGCCDPQRGEIEILQSQVTDSQQLTVHHPLAGSLLTQLGPFYSKWVVKASPHEEYPDATWQEAEQQSLWLAESALTLTQRQGYALWATVHRLIDETHHNCLGQCDPASPFFDAEQAEVYDDIMRRAYQVLDRTMGRLMASVDDETVLMLASDHGAVPNAYLCDIYRYLARHQLVTLDESGRPDMSHSQVYLKDERGGLEIFVNLKGREETGIVEPNAFDAVCARTLLALGNWHVTEGEEIRNAVSLALRKDDAVGLGFWGACAGDIVFAYNTGFVWGVSQGGEDICPVEAPGANHGPQKPTAETGMSNNYGALLMFGAGIRPGGYHDRRVSGPYTMVDPAATIAYLLDLPLATLDGRVMHDLLLPYR